MDFDDEQNDSRVSIKYKRRLDRTPERDFQKLPECDKIQLSTLRTALETTRSRIVRLRDENDKKDDIIDEERNLRKAAEETLQKYLVDLYNNPNVNSELRHRLPHAKKVDPVLQTMHAATDDTQDPTMLRDKQTTGSFNLMVGEREGDVEVSNQREAPRKRDISVGCRTDVATDGLPQLSVDPSHERLNASQAAAYQQPYSIGWKGMEPNRKENQHVSTQTAQAQAFGGYVTEPIPSSQVWFTPDSISHLLPPYISPDMYTNPLSSVSWSSLESSNYHGLPVVPGRIGQDGKEQRSRSQKDRSERILFAKGTQTTPENSIGLTQRPYISSVHSTSLPSLHHIGIPDPTQQDFLSPSVPPISVNRYCPPYRGADNISYLSRLVADNATLRKENEELRGKLKDARCEIDVLNSTAKTVEDANLEKIRALIEEIHEAEKRRDMAMKMMMDAAEKDKAAAQEELNQMRAKKIRNVRSPRMTGISDSEYSEADDFEKGLAGHSESCVTNSEGESSERRPESRKYMMQLLARQQEIMKKEMQKVLDERNQARQKVVKLEKKLTSLELAQHTDKRAEALLAKLRVTETERDMVIAKLQHLMQDVNETKLLYNLHKALIADEPQKTYQMTNNLSGDLRKNNTITAFLSRKTEDKTKADSKFS